MKFIDAAQSPAKLNRIDLTDNHKPGHGTWHLEKTNLLQGVCLYTPLSLALPLPLFAPLFRLTVDCFTSRSLWPWLLIRKTPDSQPIPFDHNSLYVCLRVPLWSILFRWTCEFRGEDTHSNQPKQSSPVSREQNKKMVEHKHIQSELTQQQRV